MRLISLIILISCISGCKSDPTEGFKDPPPVEDMDELMIKRQRALLKKDSLRIEEYISTEQEEFKQSGTGLRYHVYSHSDSDSIHSGEQVFLDYTITNLKQDTLYSSSNSGVMSLIVDHSQAESGLHELLKLMRRGEKAKAVVPSHLAHGLVGDDYKIPPSTSLVFDITVLE